MADDRATRDYDLSPYAGGLEVRADRGPFRNPIKLRIEQRRGESWSVAMRIEMRTLDPGEMWPEAADLTLHEGAAQQLMDDLWRCGIRPTEGAGSAGSLAATQHHLAEVSGILKQVLPRALRSGESERANG